MGESKPLNNRGELFSVLDRLEAKENWTVQDVQKIISTVLLENKEDGNEVFGVFETSLGSTSVFRHVELRLARKGMPTGGLLIMDLQPGQLATRDVFDRYGTIAAPQLATTDAHDHSVYYEYKKPSGVIRFTASDATSKWITSVVIDRFSLTQPNMPMTSNPITAQLSITMAHKGVEAHLVFKNVLQEVAYLNKFNVGEKGRLENNVFEITSEGQRLDYTSILAKRQAPTLGECIRLGPGETFRTIIPLDKFYKFLDAQHEYHAVYIAYHQRPDRPGWFVVKSNEVVFMRMR